MESMKIKKKDYGLFCFRVSEDERIRLQEDLNKAKARLNRGKKQDEYIFTKNQIILDAIRLGLPLLKREN